MKDKQTFSKPPYLLIKIGRKEHIENLFYRGEIFMNTISYYWNCENSQVGDDLEGPLTI